MVLLLAIVSLSLLLMLIRPGGIPEAVWVCGGAALLVVLGLAPARLAGRAVLQGTDVYLFLVGMMLLSELAREHGVFEWISTTAVRHAGGSSRRLFLLVYLAGVAVTVFMSNDATAIVLTPAVLAAVRKARVDPLPHLFTCALIANAASFVLPISNPANLVVYRQGMPALEGWLRAFALPSLLAVAATCLAALGLFRKPLAARGGAEPPPAPLPAAGGLVLAGLAAMVAVLLAASALGRDLGLPTFLCSLAVLAAVSLRHRCRPLALFRKVSWSTLALVAGLFVLVGALEARGALRLAVRGLELARALPVPLGACAVGFAVGIANNLVNNLPLGLLAGAAAHAARVRGPLADAVLIGIDLGPNLSVTGSLATILWLIALRKEGVDVGAGRFLKVGLVAMPFALALAIAGVLAAPR